MDNQYENKPKVISDKDKERSKEERASLDRQEATRGSRDEGKRVKDLRKEALNQVRSQSVTSTKDIRKVKAAEEGELLSMLGRQSQEGGIYDVETGNYDPTSNKEGTDETISNDGIDQFGVDDDDGGSSGSRTLTICVNGEPEEVTFLTG